MRASIVFSPFLKNSYYIGPCRKIDGIERVLERFSISYHLPDIDNFEIYKYHDIKIIERIKRLPFADAVIESIKCVIKGAELIKIDDLVVIPTAGTGHKADEMRFSGYSFLNDIKTFLKALESEMKCVVIDVDRHHVEGGKDYLCICEEGSCICFEEDDATLIKNFRDVFEDALKRDPDVLILYLGLDIHEREYFGNGVKTETIREIVKIFNSFNGKKVIIIAGGSRDDVAEEVFKAMMEELKII